MATRAQVQEAERAAAQFQAAMTALGTRSTAVGMVVWNELPTVPSRQALDRWVARAVRHVSTERVKARRLALAYYRYQRAVMTGRTISIPGDPRTNVSTGTLRSEFEQLAQTLSSGLPGPQVTDDVQEASEVASGAPEVSEGLNESLAQMEAREQEQFAQEINSIAGKLIRLFGEDNDPETFVRGGRRLGATMGRQVMDGARGTVWLAGQGDKRVIGYARVSRTGTPCGWCAMLISRGFMPKDRESKPGANLYRGAQGSSANVVYGDLDLYHTNCQCYAVPIYASEQLDGDLFATNREYAQLWPTVTKGYSGKDALTEWRRYFRSQKSQAAATGDDTAQEAQAA